MGSSKNGDIGADAEHTPGANLSRAAPAAAGRGAGSTADLCERRTLGLDEPR